MFKLRQIAAFFGLKRSIVGMLTMVILVGMGERVSERFLPLYLLALGGTVASIGILGALQNLLSALYSYPGGYLAERLGTKRALLVFNGLALVGYGIVILIPRWWAVLLGAMLFLSWSAISLPATMGLVARVLPKAKRTMGVSLHSFVRRIPMALGPLLGGALIDSFAAAVAIRIAFAIALLMGLVAMILQQILIEADHPKSAGWRGLAGRDPRPTAERNPLRLFRLMSPDLRNLLTADILVRFCEQIPYVFVVVWCTKIIAYKMTGFQFGILTAIEMATAMLIYIPVAYLADRSHKKPFVVITFGFFTVFPLALLFSQSFLWLIPTFVIRGLKEFGEPTRKALIMDLAPEDRKAGMFGLYYLIRDTIVTLGSLIGAALWVMSPTVNLLTATAFGLIGTLWFLFRGRDLSTLRESGR